MNFRRWITALAVLALFAGFASAQVALSTAGSGGAFTCSASVVPPTLRAEGLTELIGDIVLTCTGGPPINVPSTIGTALTPLPTANVSVSLGANVTSRLLSYASVAATPETAANTSEALLLIDEPGSTETGVVAGYGPTAPQTLCGTGTRAYSAYGAGPGGCLEYAQQVGGVYVMSSTSTVAAVPVAGANMFAGVVSANQVVFNGIPIMPPMSAGQARYFRITNVRLNANTLAGGGPAGTQSVVASVSISGSTSVPVNNSVPIVGFIQPGLNTLSGNTGLRNAANTLPGSAAGFNQCNSANVALGTGNVAIVRFTENFGTAFKTRVAPTLTLTGQGTQNQNVPGTIYNSESGFVTNLSVGANGTAGLADYGTRLKAVFNNVPSGVNIYVSTTNVKDLVSVTAPYSASAVSYAQLVLSETAPELSSAYVPGTSTLAATGISYAPIAATGVAGQYVATWEVINTNPSAAESYDFGVYLTYTANPGAGSPPITGATPATVTLSYAPTATQGAFSATAGIAASGTLPIPRFSDAASQPISLFNIVLCTTNLLFPFVTSQFGFDTGIAIMNTTADPFLTGAQQGTCQLNFYGNNQVAAFTTPIITPGQGINTAPAGNWAWQVSNLAPNFEGYIIAICNFQLAHGYAFITDLGAQKLAHGYLALILGNGSSKRAVGQSVAGVEALEN